MYSRDLRALAIRTYKVFMSCRKTAKIINVSHTTIWRWLESIERRPYSRKPKLCSEYVVQAIRSSLDADPLISTRAIARTVEEVCNVYVSKELVRVAIKKQGLTRKKARFFSSPTGLAEKTKQFLDKRNVYIHEGRNFVSIDETSFGRHGKAVYGYAPKGQRLNILRCKTRVSTVSSLVAVTCDRILRRVDKQGSFNAQSFSEFLSNLDAPAQTVILLDNVAFHHSKSVEEMAKRKNFELLYVPPYSPWYNPIEGVFSIVKRASIYMPI